MGNIIYFLLFVCLFVLLVCFFFFSSFLKMNLLIALPVTSNVIECWQYRMHSAIFIVELFSDTNAKFDRFFICLFPKCNQRKGIINPLQKQVGFSAFWGFSMNWYSIISSIHRLFLGRYSKQAMRFPASKLKILKTQ